jgi:protein-tyrosine phosphatase
VAATDHVEVWLIDSHRAERNPHLGYMLTQAADTIADLRSRGRTVLLHCVQAQSRTPTVAAAYAIRHKGIPVDQAVIEVCAALPDAHPNATFVSALSALSGSTSGDAGGTRRNRRR